jgi:hypothetical protein
VTDVWLGEDLATKKEAREQLGHLAVFGLTRRAGKTTTLRTLANRTLQDHNGAVLVFRTGRDDITFPGAYPTTPFFRARLDWHSVESMLWTFLYEKPKVYRPIIMRAVHGAHSLEDVHRAIVDQGEKSKNGWVRDRTYELDEYFQEILPWLKTHSLGTELLLARPLNVVEMEGWPVTVQNLVVAATLEHLLEKTPKRRLVPLVVLLPEARNFVPSDRATPAKLAADHFSREGAKLNLYLWIDSQSLTGVDQLLLRNFALQLQGVQTSDLEIQRICKAFEVKPKAVHSLKVGDFLLRTENGVRTIHVPLVEPTKEKIVDDQERKAYEGRIGDLERRLSDSAKQNTEQGLHIKELERRLRELEAYRTVEGATDRHEAARNPPHGETRNVEVNLDVDTIAARVEAILFPKIVARLPKGAVVEVPPKRAILSTFLEGHIARIREPLSKLADRNKRYLAYLSTQEGWQGTKAIAVTLFGYGSDAADIARSLDQAGAAEYDVKHGKVRYALLENLQKDLQGQYEISDVELAQVHAALQLEFLGMVKGGSP